MAKLGRGLEQIFGEGVGSVIDEIQAGKTEHSNNINEIDVNSIRLNPYQPRKVFDEDKIKELSTSIKEHGVFTPILVRNSVQGYELIAGERRLRASKLAGLIKIPAIVLDFKDEEMMEVALLENIQRENLNVMEESNAYQQLIERLGYTQEQLADRVGKSRAHITNTLRLLKLPVSVQKLVSENRLTMGHVRPLITLDDEGAMYDIAIKVIDEGLSVRNVENIVKDFRSTDKVKVTQKVRNNNLVYVEEIIKNKLQTNVRVENKSITIAFNDTNDLNRILDLMGCIEE